MPEPELVTVTPVSTTPPIVMLPVLLALKVSGCEPVNPFVNVHRPAPVDVKVFMLALSGTPAALLTVNGFAPVWMMPVMPAPIAPDTVESDVLVPWLVIVPVWFCAPESVIGEPAALGLS